MSHLIPQSSQDFSAWSAEIPSEEPCRLFIAETGSNPERVWLMSDDDTITPDMAMFSRILSLDLQQEMPERVEAKLNQLAGIKGKPFDMPLPHFPRDMPVTGQVNALAVLLLMRGNFMVERSPDMRRHTTSDVWESVVLNVQTGHTFAVHIAESVVDGRKRPESIWLSGHFPELLDGVCALLSMDMQGDDLTRIALKLHALTEGEPLITEGERPSNQDCLATYIGHLLLGRYVAHGLLDETSNIKPESNIIELNSHLERMRDKQWVSGG